MCVLVPQKLQHAGVTITPVASMSRPDLRPPTEQQLRWSGTLASGRQSIAESQRWCTQLSAKNADLLVMRRELTSAVESAKAAAHRTVQDISTEMHRYGEARKDASNITSSAPSTVDLSKEEDALLQVQVQLGRLEKLDLEKQHLRNMIDVSPMQHVTTNVARERRVLALRTAMGRNSDTVSTFSQEVNQHQAKLAAVEEQLASVRCARSSLCGCMCAGRLATDTRGSGVQVLHPQCAGGVRSGGEP